MATDPASLPSSDSSPSPGHPPGLTAGANRPRIFLSAVTKEFGRHRNALYHALTVKGYDVRVQEQFGTGSGTLLEKLQSEIRRCVAVVSVMGRTFGEAAPDVAEARGTHRSYTQWEYFANPRI